MDAARMLNMARRRAGLTQRELARRTGTAQPTISRIERGLMSPTVATLEPLIKACGMELEIIERPGVGVDRTLIVERLKMTPDERLRRAVEEWEGTAFIREARAR
jgi:transcriptional regulator with XRE-family HTH domain